MPKLKTHRGAAKRFKISGRGKVLRRRSGLRHILTSKRRKRKRKLGQTALVSAADAAKARRLLPYA